MAGYSERSLVDKLGIKEGMKIAILHEPEGYEKTLGIMPKKVTIHDSLGNHTYDFIQFFTTSRKDLTVHFRALVSHLGEKGMIWISWPKKSSTVETDMDEQVLRDVGLPLGVVDIKVCAVDGTWSGLKFVKRRKQ